MAFGFLEASSLMVPLPRTRLKWETVYLSPLTVRNIAWASSSGNFVPSCTYDSAAQSPCIRRKSRAASSPPGASAAADTTPAASSTSSALFMRHLSFSPLPRGGEERGSAPGGRQGDANQLLVIAGEDAAAGEGRVRPDDLAAARLQRRLQDAGTVDLAVPLGRKIGQDQVALV